MTDQKTPEYHFPNKMGRIFLLAMEEIIGHQGVNAVLNHSNLSQLVNHYPADNMDRLFSFHNISRLQVSLEQLYGVRGGRGIALRTGRASFKYGLREFGPLLGFTDLAFRLLPLDMKLRSAADIFVDLFNRFTDQNIHIVEETQRYIWTIDRCSVCWERRSDAPVCHLAVGLIQESLYWVSSGKFYQVDEVACCAKGDPACTIVIDKKFLD
jgi:predicted hydrocarbon binding protein